MYLEFLECSIPAFVNDFIELLIIQQAVALYVRPNVHDAVVSLANNNTAMCDTQVLADI